MENPDSFFVRRFADVMYQALGWDPAKPLVPRLHLEKPKESVWPVLTPNLIKDVFKPFYSKAWEFHADVWACVHADSSALREQLQKGIQAKDIGQYIVPLVRWGSAVLDKVCKILDMYKDLQFNSQREDRLLRDTWIDFHTEVRS